jgi:uncharacterized membrane protein
MAAKRDRSGSAFTPQLAAALAYAGGLIAGIIFLLVEKKDRFVRFHAMQSAITFLGVLVAHFVLIGLPLVGRVLYIPFIVGVVVLWVFLIVNAFQGKTYKLPYIGDFVEEQTKP